MYSQNNEEKIISDYFGEISGRLLSIGENDGKTFSNSRALMERGWRGVLVEPAPGAFKKLEELYQENIRAFLIRAAVADYNGETLLHDSGPHLPDRSDRSLLSTIKPEEKKRWTNVKFEPVKVEVITVAEIYYRSNFVKFDFITIDAEGMDMVILSQINLSNTKLLCIEWNGDENIKNQIIGYCAGFGIKKTLSLNLENIILAR